MHVFPFFTRTKRRQARCYLLLLTVPSPSCSSWPSPRSPILSLLSHTITKYQALPSPISRMLGELRRSPRLEIRTHSQLLLAPLFVNHTYTPWHFSKHALNGVARESCCQGLVCTQMSKGKHKTCAVVVISEKARRRKSLCVNSSTQGANVWWE